MVGTFSVFRLWWGANYLSNVYLSSDRKIFEERSGSRASNPPAAILSLHQRQRFALFIQLIIHHLKTLLFYSYVYSLIKYSFLIIHYLKSLLIYSINYSLYMFLYVHLCNQLCIIKIHYSFMQNIIHYLITNDHLFN